MTTPNEPRLSEINNLNQLTGQSAGGSMVFAGSINPTSTVTVQGTNTAPVDAYNNFRGTAVVSSGTNDVPIVATNPNGGHATTNTYQVVIAPTSGSYTYDHNGNLLTDGTRTFYYDAKNEMVGIVYASTHTDFTYDVTGARVAIIERSGTTLGSGTASSTKQFVGNEERDASGTTVTNRFYPQGEERIVSGTGTSYYYTFDHLGSIREMVASNGTTIEACYGYDPYGRSTLVSGSLSCEFQYAGMYYHSASGLNLTKYRAYNPNLGRWISRDPSGESSRLNLYAYCGDNPICNVDSLGLYYDPSIYQFTPSSPNPFIDPSLVVNPFDDSSQTDLTVQTPSSGECMETIMTNPFDSQNWHLLTPAQASFAVAMASYIAAFGTALRVIALTAVVTDPFVLAGIGIGGAILVGVELYDATEQGERSDEGKGPVFVSPEGEDWYPYENPPPPRS